MEFYILNNNEKEGPFSVEALAAKNLSRYIGVGCRI